MEIPKHIIMPMCDMLIDQNKYIGDDPIGHACFNQAMFTMEDTHFVCVDCANKLKNGGGNVSIPVHGGVSPFKARAAKLEMGGK